MFYTLMFLSCRWNLRVLPSRCSTSRNTFSPRKEKYWRISPPGFFFHDLEEFWLTGYQPESFPTITFLKVPLVDQKLEPHPGNQRLFLRLYFGRFCGYFACFFLCQIWIFVAISHVLWWFLVLFVVFLHVFPDILELFKAVLSLFGVILKVLFCAKFHLFHGDYVFFMPYLKLSGWFGLLLW